MAQIASGSRDPWEVVKPVLESLWLKEDWKLDRIVQEMKASHSFYRVERQYKSQFAIWGWSKNVRKSDITKALKHVKGRAVAGKFSTQVSIKGKKIDNQKIRRVMKEQTREITGSLALLRRQITTVDGHVLPFTNNFFLKWNLPYAAMRRSYVKPFDHSSPFDQATPYSNIEVTTPSSVASPNDLPSPTNQVMKKLMMVERASMFAQGHHEKLLTLLNGEERRTLSDWLHEYWFFCFKTAKHWGKGPKTWTAELLEFDGYQPTAHRGLPGTPQDLMSPATPDDNEPRPSDLCRWYIHVPRQSYVPIPEGQVASSAFVQDGIDDDPSWTPWPPGEQQSSLQAHLRDALEHNDFSLTSATELPVDIPRIAQAADERRSDELLIESLGFSIMSRNIEQVRRVLYELEEKKIDTTPLRPFHLATSYLDGSKSCCDVLATVAMFDTGSRDNEIYFNEHGHTVLDNLMIAIIKSHSSAKPEIVDDAFKGVARFVGEEIDICGRWDADSPCVRQMHVNGGLSIPSSWKHKFCNTSIQAICHCIARMFEFIPRPFILKTPSGLYIRRCFDPECGKKLQLSPLHSLVITAYHLASQGRDGEDLFGILACALCLIFEGFDPSMKADISIRALLSSSSVIECDHEELTAAELAEKIMAEFATESWSAMIKTGWTVLAGVLRRCEMAAVEKSGDGNDNSEWSDDDDNDDFMGCTEPDPEVLDMHQYSEVYFCGKIRKDLGALWSSVQAELLSYRRLDDRSDWTSQNFSMETLQVQLSRGEDLIVGYAARNLLKAHCACHSFGRYPFAVLGEALDPDLANLDLWGRATYGEMIYE
ncbi:hypothetical protein HBI26_120050 [Parastagonospora nodorum]|nr:hypothetical protein HBI29_106840 [Parastagonospora nodorum]KAH5582784.1 hypothetical protein HBI26_120050 [Parastagonospora nodorum]KAH6209896.1 hypothetical protein HBI53_115190 [Parastagonospora nodorum]